MISVSWSLMGLRLVGLRSGEGTGDYAGLLKEVELAVLGCAVINNE